VESTQATLKTQFEETRTSRENADKARATLCRPQGKPRAAAASGIPMPTRQDSGTIPPLCALMDQWRDLGGSAVSTGDGMKAAIFGLCLLAVGVGVLSSGIRSLMLDKRARSWATTEGTIVSSKCVDYYDWDNGRSFFTHVDYRYSVAGKSYQGDRIAFGYSGSWWRRPNQRIADRLSSAKTVLVRYDPDKPSMAVLSCGLNGSTVRALFIGTWLLLVTAVVFLRAVPSRGTTITLTLSSGLRGLKITPRGVGGILLLVVAGLVIGSLLSAMIDLGILSTLVTS
jgi:hypothetical protein